MGRYDLGLLDSEFWALDPGQLSALLVRVEEDWRRAYWRAAVIASTVATVNSKKRYKISDFMPRGMEPNTPKPSQEMLLAKVVQLNAMFGGLDLREEKTDSKR